VTSRRVSYRRSHKSKTSNDPERVTESNSDEREPGGSVQKMWISTLRSFARSGLATFAPIWPAPDETATIRELNSGN